VTWLVATPKPPPQSVNHAIVPPATHPECYHTPYSLWFARFMPSLRGFSPLWQNDVGAAAEERYTLPALLWDGLRTNQSTKSLETVTNTFPSPFLNSLLDIRYSEVSSKE